MKSINSQSGIAPLAIVVALTTLLITTFAGYKVFYQNKDTKPTPDTTSVTTPSTTTKPTTSTEPTTTNPTNKTMGILKGQVQCTDKIDPKPCGTSFELYSTTANPGNGSYIQPTIVDSSGVYSIELEPGTYNITPAPKNGYPMILRSTPNPVEIKAGQTTILNIDYRDDTR